MWREIWEAHRAKICTILGAAVFLLTGAVACLLEPLQEKVDAVPPVQAREETRERQPGEVSPIENMPGTPASPVPGTALAAPDWYLYITGSVRKPGVYRLPPGARLFQLVEAAGGLDGFADAVAVNLAGPLQDGLHVHVPRKGERAGDASRSSVPNVAGFIDLAPLTPEQGSGPGFQGLGRMPAGREGLVDINRATEERLATLRGIGPTLARRIVEYRRQHGPFRNVEGLIQVRGIGASKLKGLRDQVVAMP